MSDAVVRPKGRHGEDSQMTAETEMRKRTFGLPFGNKEEEDRKGTWGDTGYSASDAEAHRDRTYEIPSMVKQTMVIFMVQMKLFSKMKWTYIMLFIALLIPILYFLGGDFISMLLQMYGFDSVHSTIFISGLLSAMPLMMGLFTSILCGKQIPQEFRDRTAYMNVSLPISRVSFYLGKYLAGFVMSLAIFLFAYGMAIATAMTEYDTIFADLLGTSLVYTVIAVFAYTATAFCIGSVLKRGSSLIPFILMSVVIPVIAIILMANALEGGATDVSSYLLLPSFLCEAALSTLGAPTSISSGLVVMSFMDASDYGTMAVIGIVWGLAFLILGMFRTMRREM